MSAEVVSAERLNAADEAFFERSTGAPTLVLEPDPGPLARFEAVKSQPYTPAVVFQRVAEGETLKEIARAWEVPVGTFVQWFTEEHADRYDAALKVRADDLAHESLDISDGATPETLGASKLRVETRLRLAEKWDRQRYGAKQESAAGGITVVLDPSCGGAVQLKAGGHTLTIEKRSTQAPEKVIEGENDGDHRGTVAGPARRIEP